LKIKKFRVQFIEREYTIRVIHYTVGDELTPNS